MMESSEKAQKTPWYVREESDNTVRLIGGLIIFALAMIGLFLMEYLSGNVKSPIYLKEGIVHAIFGYITGWISAGGLKKTNMNGGNKP